MTDPGVLPSRSVSIMTLEFYRDDATRESYFVIVLALFDCFNTENLRVAQFLTNIRSLPMGVTLVNYIYWTIFFRFLYLFLETEISSDARPALPMGVAPEAIVESFSSIGSSRLFFASLCSCLFCVIISMGARLALPIVVAPKAIVEMRFRV
jgi:hypothetical protein